MNDRKLALTCIIGVQDELWIYPEVDEVEWTDPTYYHQN